MKKFSMLGICVAVLIWFLPAGAIVIRHDVDDSEYLDFATNYSESIAYTDYCAFTLISPEWLLTAAHCMTGGGRIPFSVAHLGSIYRVNQVIIHPEFSTENDELNDVALIQLKDSISNGTPVSIYTDQLEEGKRVIFIGRGTTGNGEAGLQRHDERERAATNTVQKTSDQHLIFKFDPPSSATSLEGISGPADSGGPALLEVDGNRFIVGISGFQDRNGYEQAHYNVLEYYSRVSTHSDWILTTISETPPVSRILHPLLSAVINNDIQSFEQASAEIEAASLRRDVLDEVYYQVINLNRTNIFRHMLLTGYPISPTRINNLSLFEFTLTRDRAELFDMLLEKTESMTDIHDQSSMVFPLMVRRFRRETGVEERAQVLISQGANINAQLESGDTALISTGWATNNIPFIKWLVENGADINLSNNSGDTPLMDSARLGKMDTFNYLLSQNADTTLRNRGGVTALDIARARGRSEMVRILEDM